MTMPTLSREANRELKASMRTAWALGDYHRFAKETVWSLGPVLVEACGVGPGLRVLNVAAGMIRPNAGTVPFEPLQKLIEHSDQGLRLEAVRLLGRHATEQRFELLKSIAHDQQQPSVVRAEAILGLAIDPEPFIDDLITFVSDKDPAVRDESLRSLVGLQLTETQTTQLRNSSNDPATLEARRALRRHEADAPGHLAPSLEAPVG